MLSRSISARSFSGITRRTLPVLPRSRPAMTITVSFFLMRARMVSSEHLGRQRQDLHELLGAQLARHRSEDARADRLALVVDQHRRVAVERDVGAVGPPHFLGGADDDGLHDVALLHL